VAPVAYEYFLGGVDLYSRSEFLTAIEMLRKSVEIDPTYALTWGRDVAGVRGGVRAGAHPGPRGQAPQFRPQCIPFISASMISSIKARPKIAAARILLTTP
jgi:hypothetical protein